MAIVREDDGGHVLYLGEALDPEDHRGGPDEVRRFTAAISAAVEEFILARPGQWFWVHRRWKGAHEAG
jgi:KDO2-lipid IV(A) lauroyltransferase